MQDKILEVECIIDDEFKIVVKSNGEVLATPLPGKDIKSLADCKMPTSKFWGMLGEMIENMDKQIKTKDLLMDIMRTELELHRTINKQEKRQLVISGMSKKGMFAAGVVFGKAQRK